MTTTNKERVDPRIVTLAEAIRAQLGPNWTVSYPYANGADIRYVEPGPDGNVIEFYLRHEGERAKLSPIMPSDVDGRGMSARDWLGEALKLSGGVNLDRMPRAAARSLIKRVVTPYVDDVHPRIREKLRTRIGRRVQRDETGRILAEACGTKWEPEKGKPFTARVDVRVTDGFVIFEPQEGGGVDVDLPSNLSVETALRILDVLRNDEP